MEEQRTLLEVRGSIGVIRWTIWEVRVTLGKVRGTLGDVRWLSRRAGGPSGKFGEP